MVLLRNQDDLICRKLNQLFKNLKGCIKFQQQLTISFETRDTNANYPMSLMGQSNNFSGEIKKKKVEVCGR